MKRRLVIICLVATCVMAIITVLLRPDSRFDFSGDEMPFNTMATPLRSVSGDMIMDGGSIEVVVTDGYGIGFTIIFPIDRDKLANPYPTAEYIDHPSLKRVPLKNPARAKQIAIRLLQEYGVGNSIQNEDTCNGNRTAIICLSDPLYIKAGRVGDKLKKLFR